MYSMYVPHLYRMYVLHFRFQNATFLEMLPIFMFGIQLLCSVRKVFLTVVLGWSPASCCLGWACPSASRGVLMVSVGPSGSVRSTSVALTSSAPVSVTQVWKPKQKVNQFSKYK